MVEVSSNAIQTKISVLIMLSSSLGTLLIIGLSRTSGADNGALMGMGTLLEIYKETVY